MVSESTEFIIGSSVSCSDGPSGELTRVVVDPAARSVTHLVVGPPHRGGTSRLVPVRLAGAGTAAIHLRCTMSQFEGLQVAEETQIVPGALGELGHGPDHKLSAPYYGRGGMGLAMAVGTGLGAGTAPRRITSDRIPAGKVEVRRGEHVHATDGPHREGPGAGRRYPRAPCDSHSARRGSPLGQAAGSHPDRRGGRLQRRCPAQSDQG
jgi:hypothetical protein